MKILIAVPCMDQVATPFAQSIASLNKKGDCLLSFMMSSLVYDSRNKLVGQAMQMEADYIMWFDSDMIFAPDTMERLFADIEENDLDIVTGLYFNRRPPFTPVIFSELDGDINSSSHKDYNDYPENSLFEVAGCGFGCVLMKTDVLYDIAAKDGPVWFSPLGNIGEDCAFCIRARKHGYKIMCDSNVKLGHIGTTVVNEELYKAMADSRK